MVAHSFKKRFVEPIQAGLGQQVLPGIVDPVCPKRQTIRAGSINGRGEAKSPGGKRLGAPGDMLQLYCGQRTKECFSIGVARCTSVHSVIIWIDAAISGVMVDGKLLGPRQLRDFVRADGFKDFNDMRAFWAKNHGVKKFSGVLIKWEPL